MSRWKSHPHVRSGERLTRGERAADQMRNGMGSWPFVFVALVFLAVWMAFNRDTGFDPYPFILLNLVLSCIAALQGAGAGLNAIGRYAGCSQHVKQTPLGIGQLDAPGQLSPPSLPQELRANRV